MIIEVASIQSEATQIILGLNLETNLTVSMGSVTDNLHNISNLLFMITLDVK
jgi:hypothetical protein